MDNMSPADFRAVMGDNCNGWGGNNIIWLFLALAWLGGGFGFGGNRNGGCATTDELSAGFNFSGVNNKLNELVAGQANINQNLSNAICQLGYQGLEHQAALSAQFANCCCETQRAIDGVKFDMANYASGIMQNDTANTQKVLDKLCGMELAQEQRENANLRARVQQLENREYVQAATAGIPRINTDAWGVRLYPSCCQPCGTSCCGVYPSGM